MELPPGFRFNPTDEELITHYLYPKVVDVSFCPKHIAEIDMNRFEPRDLPGTAKMGGKERYYLCVRDRTQPPELRTTAAGYWKATGKCKEICRVKTLIGLKASLVYQDRSSTGSEEKKCVMHEYRLEGINNSNLPENAKNEWVICKVFWKSCGSLVDSIKIDDIQKCFDKPLDEAAKECGVSRSTFKRACRKHGIQGWQSSIPKKRKKANEQARGERQQGEEHEHEHEDSREGMHTAAPQDHQSNLVVENGLIMASSSMCTQGIGTTSPPDNTRTTTLSVKVEYNSDVVMFVLPNATVDGLKTEILKRFKLRAETLKIRYKDGDEEMVSVACDEDLHYCLEFFKSTGVSPVRFSLLI